MRSQPVQTMGERVDTWCDTAIASFHWKMLWSASGMDNSAAGHALFVLHGAAESAGRKVWRVVWRTMVLEPGAG